MGSYMNLGHSHIIWAFERLGLSIGVRALSTPKGLGELLGRSGVDSSSPIFVVGKVPIRHSV